MQGRVYAAAALDGRLRLRKNIAWARGQSPANCGQLWDGIQRSLINGRACFAACGGVSRKKPGGLSLAARLHVHLLNIRFVDVPLRYPSFTTE
jgi:hypothetical protein